MTTYLWYSAKQERLQEKSNKDGLHDRFNPSLPRRGFLVALDSYGEPVRITQITHDADHGTKLQDIRCLDILDGQETLLLSKVGGLEEAGYAYCRERGIGEDINSLLQYMGQYHPRPLELRMPMTVGKPLRLKSR